MGQKTDARVGSHVKRACTRRVLLRLGKRPQASVWMLQSPDHHNWLAGGQQGKGDFGDSAVAQRNSEHELCEQSSAELEKVWSLLCWEETEALGQERVCGAQMVASPLFRYLGAYSAGSGLKCSTCPQVLLCEAEGKSQKPCLQQNPSIDHPSEGLG